MSKKDYFYTLELNFAVFLFGGAGLFGKLLNYPPAIIVLARVVFSALFLFVFVKIRRVSFFLKNKGLYLTLFFSAVLLSFHWIAFFQAVKLSTVALALLSYSTFPVFISLMEPFFFKSKISMREIMISIVALLGIYILIPSFSLSSLKFKGVMLGIVSGFLFALLSIVNRKQVKNIPSIIVTFYQHLFSVFILLPLSLSLKKAPSLKEWAYFILLGILFTAVAHLLFIDSLVRFKAFTAGIIATMEPVYGSLFALIVLKEIPATRTLVGGMIVLGASVYAIISSSKNKGGYNGI